MSERIERTHSAEVEEALGALFGAPEPDPAFVDGLECRLMAQEAEPSPLQCLQELIWRPLLRHRWATIGLAVLLALAVAFVAIGPRRVWADLQRLLGYVPGVGFVNLEETRVLTAPVTVTRGGVTLRVEQVLAQPEGTTIVISSEGLSPEDEFWPEGVEMEEGFEPRLRLPDDKSLEPDTFTLRWGAGTLEFPPLPSEVYRLNLELPRLPLVPAGIAAEDWEIPLTLRPATGELVDEIFPQPYAPPDASDTHQGVTLHVLGVAHDPEETAVKLQLQWQDPAWKFPRIGARGAINLRDDVGHVYERAITPNSGSSSSSVVVAVPEPTDSTPTPEPTMPTHEYTYPFSPVSLAAQELTLKIEGIAFDVPVDTDFTVDLGEAPQVGDTWPLDIDLQVAGFPIHIRCARLIEEEIGSREESKRRTVLQFDVVRPPEQGGRGLTGIGLDGEAAGFRGGSTSGGRPGADTFHIGLVVEQGDQIPDGLIQVRVVRAELALNHTWEVTWSIPGHRASERPYTLHFTTAPAEDVLLINKWHYELMEADYQYFSFLVRAAMVDPAVIELNAMVSDEEDNLLFDIGAMLQEQVENSHSVEAFQDLPGKNPWGETDKPVYKKLLPSEMKAMNIYAGQYAGDCSSISHLTVALCRMNGIPEDDIFVLRTKQHSLVLVQYQSVVYMINDTYVDELSPVELFFVNLYWNTGLYNDRYSARAGYVLSKDKLSGPGTLKEKFERHYNVQFRDMQDEWMAEEVETLTNLAMQKRSTPIADVVSASERGPIVNHLFPTLPTIEASVDWLNENVGTASIFPYDAFMTPDQVIVFKTASPFDKALFLVCYCRIKGIACEMLQSGEETYVIRAASKAYLVGETITETEMENDSTLIPVYRF